MLASPLPECRVAARELACRRGDRLLFSGLSFEVGAGEVLHVAGSNGIGKSSLLRIVAGLLSPFAGAVERHGPTGLIDERTALDPMSPLGEALAFWRRIDGPADAQLARLGLADLLDVPVRYLSTGQRKRAAFGRLLGQRAAIWLLDEPLNGLDESAVELACALVEEHRSAGGACIVASHQPFAMDGMARLHLRDFTP